MVQKIISLNISEAMKYLDFIDTLPIETSTNRHYVGDSELPDMYVAVEDMYEGTQVLFHVWVEGKYRHLSTIDVLKKAIRGEL